jgi:AhpD family alkylhydroperoxidase
MSAEIRVPLVQPGTRPELAEVERVILAERGSISLLYQALLNSPPIASGWERLLTAVRKQTQVPPAIRELAILRVAVLNGASFEFAAHVPHALDAGVSPDKIEAVRSQGSGAPSEGFDDEERLALELTDAMTLEVEVPAELMRRVQVRYGTRVAVELVATIAAYNMVSRFLVALNLRHP